MRFTAPWWLVGGVLACLVVALGWWRYDARQRAALARFVGTQLRGELTQSVSSAKRRLQRGLFLAALACLCVALAGPQWGFRWETISRRGNEIVFAVDTSRSMSTPDIKPDRLTRAKLAIDDFTQRLDGDAVGIVAFAGDAFLVCPITLDYGAFHESLAALDTDTIPRGGTNISSAIHEAQAALRRRPGSDKILILVTDGEDLEGEALAAAQDAKREGMVIYTVGVGTAAGDLIPLPPQQGGGFVKDESGAYVKSRLDQAALQAIATATGGFYVPLGAQGEGLENIHRSVLGPLAKHDLASRRQKIYTERYQGPLAAALGLLLASLLVGNRRRAPVRRAAPQAPPARASTSPRPATATAAALALACLSTAPAARALAAEPTAPTAPAAPAPAPAPAPAAPLVDYNRGTAAYRAGQYPQAAHAFQQSIVHAPSSDARRLADQEDAYYNLGNTLYRSGQKTQQAAPQDTLKTWNDAVKAYETALQLRPGDRDSKYNRDLVKRKIAELQQQQQKPPPSGGQKPPQNKDQGQGQGQGQGQNPPQQSGQPPPPSQGQPQPNQRQPQQGQPPGGQPPGGQPPGGQNPPQQAGQPPPPSPAPGQQPQSPPPPQQAPPQKSPGPSPPDDERDADEQRVPGQMSREEARELLDSLKDDERRQPISPIARDSEHHDQRPPAKNW